MVLLTTYEDYNDCGGAVGGGSNPYDGVVLDFGLQIGGMGYFYSDVDLSMDPNGLFWQLPMDGVGAYQYAYGTAFDPTTGQFTLDTTAGTQPPILNVNDFLCFQTAFAAGCSAP
jgi:hypothetical protein